MRVFAFLPFLFLVQLAIGQDTLFLKYNDHPEWDSIAYKTDTMIYPSPALRHYVLGTAVLPWTELTMTAKNYGLNLDSVTRSDCQEHGERVYRMKDKINYAVLTDSTFVVDITFTDNCCYDFLCDAGVEDGVVNVTFTGYGTHCACLCCFGLTYHFSYILFEDAREIRSVVINDNPETNIIVERK